MRGGVDGRDTGPNEKVHVVLLVPPGGLTYQSARSSSDRRYVLDSGGRPKGTPGSRPMRVTRSRKPSSRRVTAALPPAMAPPMITIPVPPAPWGISCICPPRGGEKPADG